MITNHRLSILHRPKRPSAAQKNLEHADVEFQKEQVCLQLPSSQQMPAFLFPCRTRRLLSSDVLSSDASLGPSIPQTPSYRPAYMSSKYVLCAKA